MLCKRRTILELLVLLLGIGAALPVLAFSPDKPVAAEEDRAIAMDTVGGRAVVSFRLEELEYELINYQSPREGFPSPATFVFEIRGCGRRLGSNSFVVTSEGCPTWRVAVNRETGAAYRLHGFRDRTKEFDRMASEIGISIRDKNDARGYLRFYYKLVNSWDLNFLPSDSLNLRYKVERSFFYNYKPKSRGRRYFQKWWNKFEKENIRVLYKLRVKQNGENFRITFHKLEGIMGSIPSIGEDGFRTKEPILWEYSYRITVDGHINQVEKKKIFEPRVSTRVLPKEYDDE